LPGWLVRIGHKNRLNRTETTQLLVSFAYKPQKGAPLAAAFGGAIEHLARGLAVDLAPIFT
jgi:hypothetical protein